jgi:hypothetical protein
MCRAPANQRSAENHPQIRLSWRSHSREAEHRRPVFSPAEEPSGYTELGAVSANITKKIMTNKTMIHYSLLVINLNP